MGENLDVGGTAPPSGLPAISPTLGEIRCRRRFRQISNVAVMSATPKLPISPLVGEMSGRTEGGAKDRCDGRL